MKPKFLTIIALSVLLSSCASAQTFGFGTAGGSYIYCNYVELNLYGGAVWQGVDNLSPCGFDYNPTIIGTSGGLTASNNPLGFSVRGVSYADGIFDAFAGTFTDTLWYVVTDKKCAKFKNGHFVGKFGWVAFAGVTGVVFADNYGYVSCQLPGQSGSPPVKDVSYVGFPLPVRK